MIEVKAVGGLSRRLGRASFQFAKDSMLLYDLIKDLFQVDQIDVDDFLSDIIVAINGVAVSEALQFVKLVSGDKVTLIPVSHGG